MSNKNLRRPADMVSKAKAERIMKSTMAREHALIAIDHLFRARQLAHQARGPVQLVSASGGKTENDIILEMAEDTWKGLVGVFMQAGIIKPGDIGRYGIPAADRTAPGDRPPGSNGQHAVDLSSPKDSHGEEDSPEESDEGDVEEVSEETREEAGPKASPEVDEEG